MAEPNIHQVTPPPLPPQVSYTPSYLEEKAIEFGPASPIDSGAEIYKIWGDFIGSGIQFTETLKKLEYQRQKWKLEEDIRVKNEAIREDRLRRERRRMEILAKQRIAGQDTRPTPFGWDFLSNMFNSLGFRGTD